MSIALAPLLIPTSPSGPEYSFIRDYSCPKLDTSYPRIVQIGATQHTQDTIERYLGLPVDMQIQLLSGYKKKKVKTLIHPNDPSGMHVDTLFGFRWPHTTVVCTCGAPKNFILLSQNDTEHILREYRKDLVRGMNALFVINSRAEDLVQEANMKWEIEINRTFPCFVFDPCRNFHWVDKTGQGGDSVQTRSWGLWYLVGHPIPVYRRIVEFVMRNIIPVVLPMVYVRTDDVYNLPAYSIDLDRETPEHRYAYRRPWSKTS